MNMKRFWKEILWCYHQIRDGYPRQTTDERFDDLVRPLLSLELGPYSYIECLAAVTGAGIPWSWHGHVARMLYNRSNRGKETLETAKKILSARVGRWVEY